jgi:hypothetical protein
VAPTLSTAFTWTLTGRPARGVEGALSAKPTTPELMVTVLEGAEAGLEPSPLNAVTLKL